MDAELEEKDLEIKELKEENRELRFKIDFLKLEITNMKFMFDVMKGGKCNENVDSQRVAIGRRKIVW